MDARERQEMNADSLARGLEAALRVDPSPELRAKIRARVAGEHMRNGWAFVPSWRGALAACAVSAIAVAAVWQFRTPSPAVPQRTTISVPANQPESRLESGEAAEQRRPARDRSTRPSDAASSETGALAAVFPVPPSHDDPPAEREVVIWNQDAVALRDLAAVVAAGQLQAAALPVLDPADEPLPAIEAIELEPITLTPIARLNAIEGVRQ